MEEEEMYECPECGASFAEGVNQCPGCGTEFEWEEPDEEESVDVDEILDEISPDAAGSDTPEDEDLELPDEAEEEVEEEVEEEAEGEAEEEAEEEEEEPEAPLEETEEEEVEEDLPMVPTAPPATPGGTFSMLGKVFALLTIIALIGTILILRWDTWINGAAEESIGDNQRLFVYLGAAGIVVCALITLFDIARQRSAAVA